MPLARLRQFQTDRLTDQQVAQIAALAATARVDTLEMISTAGSGHPGGALSSLDLFLMLWLCANVAPEAVGVTERDRIVVSHGHTAAGLYAVLGNLGFLDIAECVAHFRQDGSIYEGHPNIAIPGVEWCSGSLGQGLSVGCGLALAAHLRQIDFHVFVVMGDGEQAKGQIQEAREFAVKYGLRNLTTIIDANGLQASGALQEIMPQAIAAKYQAAGWRVLEVEGHDYRDLYAALRDCYAQHAGPTAILAHTVMGKGAPGIEDRYEYHGQVLSPEQQREAVQALRGSGALTIAVRSAGLSPDEHSVELRVQSGTPCVYVVGRSVDCRTAAGEAVYDLAVANATVPMAAVDCDLIESVRLQKLAAAFPARLVECGIQEHNAATMAAALSTAGVLTFFSDFGVFGIDETYGQHRMSDLNHTSMKLLCTHCGLDVGEDGKTHQCVDYLSLLLNLWGWRILIPADANQTDRMVRYAATTPGNIAVLMGRSKTPILTNEQGEGLYDNAGFTYGAADWVRHGMHGTIVTCGSMVWRAVKAHDMLQAQGWQVGVLNLCCPADLDTETLCQAAATGIIITYEDHNIRTGIGSLVGAFLAEEHLACRFTRLGVTQYGQSASSEYQYRRQGLDEHHLADIMAELLITEPSHEIRLA